MSDKDKLIQNSLLFLAIRTKNLTSTQLGTIIEHGGDINAKDANDGNNTPLHVAANSGDLEIVRLLLDQGAKVAEKNSSGQTPLEVAKSSAVVSLLQEYLPQVPEIKSPQESMQSIPENSTTATKPFSYTKRSGTSGIGGQLYETKLLTLILFRALISTDIVEFYLGSNVDGLGALDDVVFWYRTRDDKTRLILIQAKHRDEPKKEGTLTLGGILKEKGDYSLHKYFASYLSIRRKFGSKSENDPIFSEKVDCDYVLYTPARENFECKQSLDPKNASFNTCQDDLLYSTDCGKTFKCHYSLEHVNILAEVASKLRYQSLGSSLADFILSDEKKRENMLLDNLIKTYHVVLVQKVFNISETGQASFKEDFFETTEKSLVILREAMYDKVLENRKQSIRDTDLQNYTNALSNNPSAENISKLLGIVIKYNSQTNTLEVINARDELDDLKNGIKTTAVTPEIIRKATEIEGRSALSSLNVKLPANFGNFDWTVSKNRRMKHIVQKFKELFELATENRVRIDNSMVNSGKIKGKVLNSGEVKQDGGLAGMVGNILVRDPSTELLKFNCDENSLQPKAKKLLEMLKTEIGDALEHYRFDITIDGFPQLTLERNAIDEKLAKCFLDNMLFYTNQAKESEIDKILKDEIQVRYKISDPIFCDAVFSMVHDKVVNLWKQQGNVPYLTKNCDYFDKVVAQVRYNPPLTNLSAVCIPQINRFQIKFNTASVDALATQIRSGVTNIISSHVEQCCIKLLQHFSADSRLFITEQYLQVALPYLRQMLQLTPDLWKTIIVVGDQKTIGGIEEIITGFEKFQKQLIVLP